MARNRSNREEHLTITAARTRMIRGETQFNRVSRFVKEIPRHLLAGEVYEPKTADSPVTDDAYQRAKKAFRSSATSYSSYDQSYQGSTFGAAKSKVPTYTPVSNQRAFASTNTAKASLDYGVGDRVRHIKFGDGRSQYKMNNTDTYEKEMEAIYREFSEWLAEWEI